MGGAQGSDRFGVDESKMMERLWGENYFDPNTRKRTTENTGSADCKRGFVQFVYEPIAFGLGMDGRLLELYIEVLVYESFVHAVLWFCRSESLTFESNYSCTDMVDWSHIIKVDNLNEEIEKHNTKKDALEAQISVVRGSANGASLRLPLDSQNFFKVKASMDRYGERRQV
ncbi:hypothetical protein Tco_0987717 [Tanacetum coccineum]